MIFLDKLFTLKKVYTTEEKFADLQRHVNFSNGLLSIFQPDFLITGVEEKKLCSFKKAQTYKISK